MYMAMNVNISVQKPR